MPAGEGDLREAFPRSQHQVLGITHPLPGDVADRRLTEGFLEGSREVTRAQLRHLRQVGGADAAAEMTGDVLFNTLRLPRREPAALRNGLLLFTALARCPFL